MQISRRPQAILHTVNDTRKPLGLRDPQAAGYTQRNTTPEAAPLLNPDVKKLLKKHQQLNHLDNAKVVSHVQRDSGDWVINTLMLDGYDVAFTYKRKTSYRSLEGGRVNLTYYSESKTIAGLAIETMNVVRIRRA